MTTERRPQNKDATMTAKELFLEQHKDNPRELYLYARDVVIGRWPEAEPTIMKDPEYAHYYSRYVTGERWPEAEPTIMKYPKYWMSYSGHFKL